MATTASTTNSDNGSNMLGDSSNVGDPPPGVYENAAKTAKIQDEGKKRESPDEEENVDCSPSKRSKTETAATAVKHRRRGKKKHKDKRAKKEGKKSSANSNNMGCKSTDAPRNTTQFIMNDHSDTNQYLDHELNVTPEDYK